MASRGWILRGELQGKRSTVALCFVTGHIRNILKTSIKFNLGLIAMPVFRPEKQMKDKFGKIQRKLGPAVLYPPLSVKL